MYRLLKEDMAKELSNNSTAIGVTNREEISDEKLAACSVDAAKSTGAKPIWRISGSFLRLA